MRLVPVIVLLCLLPALAVADEQAVRDAEAQASTLHAEHADALENDPERAPSVLDELIALGDRFGTAPAIRTSLADRLRAQFAANHETATPRATQDRLLVLLRSLADAEGAGDRVRMSLLKTLVHVYEDAQVSDDGTANAVLAEMRGLVESGEHVEWLRFEILRAFHYAHYELGNRDETARTLPLVDAAREIAMRDAATEAQRSKFSAILVNDMIDTWAPGDGRGARSSARLEELHALAHRDEATGSQRADLVRAWRHLFTGHWDAGKRVEAAVFLALMAALVKNETESVDPGDVFASALDDFHRRAETDRDRLRALDGLRGLTDVPESTAHRRRGLLRALVREHKRVRNDRDDARADTLLDEIRARAGRGSAGPPDALLATALSDAHRTLGSAERFERADALRAEIRRLATHSDATPAHRAELAIALSDAIWDAVFSSVGRDFTPLLAELRALTRRLDTTPYTRALIIRALRFAHEHDHKSSHIAEGRARWALEPDNEHMAIEMSRLLEAGIEPAFEDGMDVEKQKWLDELVALVDRDPGIESVRESLADALLNAYSGSAEHGALDEGAVLLKRLAELVSREDATQRERLQYARALFNQHYFAVRRRDRADALAALHALRIVADKEGATTDERIELIQALRSEHYTLRERDSGRADPMLAEIRRRTTGDGVTSAERDELAKALNNAHSALGDRKLFKDADELLAELRVLGHGRAATEIQQARLAAALSNALHDTCFSGRGLDRDQLLFEIRGLAEGAASSENIRLDLAYALSNLVSDRAEARRPEARSHLGELRALAKANPEHTAVLTPLARALMWMHYELASDDDARGAAASLAEIRILDRTRPRDAERSAELAEALSDAAGFAFSATGADGPERGYAFVNELFDLAVGPTGSESTRDQLADAMAGAYDHSESLGAVSKGEGMWRKLRVIGRRDAATPTQRRHLAHITEREHARVWHAGGATTTHLDLLRTIAGPTATSAARADFIEALMREVITATDAKQTARAHALVDEMESLTNAGDLSLDARGTYVDAVQRVMALWIGQSDETADALRRKLRDRAMAEDAVTIERSRYAEALRDAVRAARKREDTARAGRLLEVFDLLIEHAGDDADHVRGIREQLDD